MGGQRWFLTQHPCVAGSLTGAGSSQAQTDASSSTGLCPSPKQASCNSPACTATTSQAAATGTPTQHPSSSADFVLTAPDTQGNPQVMERIHIMSPFKMLAADTRSPYSFPSAAGLYVQTQGTTSHASNGRTNWQNQMAEPNGETEWQNQMAEPSQLLAAPAVHGPPDALHDSFTPAGALEGAPKTGLLGAQSADAHTDSPDRPIEQTSAGNPVTSAHLQQQGNVGSAGMA